MAWAHLASGGEAARRHPAWVEVDLAALVANAETLRDALPDPADLGILVKANGYGHGALMAARAARLGGADRLIVAFLDEALDLRLAGIRGPMLVVYPPHPSGVRDAVEAGVELSVGSAGAARGILEAARAMRDRDPAGHPLRFHLEVDTGMGRGGIRPEDVVAVADAAARTEAVEIAGMWTHLADGADARRSAAQVRVFELATRALGAAGHAVPPRHVSASDAMLAATAPQYDMVRIGLAYYGELGPGLAVHPTLRPVADALRPAMAVKARAVRVETVPAGSSVGYGGEWTATRASRIATLPIGYADGWSRASWPGTNALVRGVRVPVAGRVSMDSLCVDVTDAGEVALDDEFVLLGEQGGERITVAEIAQVRGTIPNEVLASLGPRLPRVYPNVPDDGSERPRVREALSGATD